MKFSKRVMALLIAVVMAFAATTAVFATGEVDTTVVNSTEGHSYEAYQIFSGKQSTDSAVLSDVDWGSGVDGTALLTELKGITDTNDILYGVFSSCTNAEDVAKALAGTSTDSTTKRNEQARAFAKIAEKHLTTTKTSIASTDKSVSIQPGYYLIKDVTVFENDATGTYDNLSLLQVTGNTIKIQQKNSVPKLEKKVWEESGNGFWGDIADYDEGDMVKFQLTASSLPSSLADYDTYKLVFHDTLSAGLTFTEADAALTVKVLNASDSSEVATVDASKYTINTNTTDGCTFEVVIDDIKTLTGKAPEAADSAAITMSSGYNIVVEYKAKLNSSAVVGVDTSTHEANPNKALLEYSNNPNYQGGGSTGKTPEDTVTVLTYEIDVTKLGVSEDGTQKIALQGVTFKLYKDISGQKYFATIAEGKVTGWTTTEASGSVLTTDSNGKFSVIGLDEGTYYLQEETTVAGYNKLTDPIAIVVVADVTGNVQDYLEGTSAKKLDEIVKGITATVDGTAVTVSDTDTSTLLTDYKAPVTVENYHGATLPETGGMGTKVIYTLGAILVCGAAILLITRRRMANH